MCLALDQLIPTAAAVLGVTALVGNLWGGAVRAAPPTAPAGTRLPKGAPPQQRPDRHNLPPVTAAILGGLGASLCFSVSALCASAASRQIGATSTLAYVMAIGLVLVVPALAISTAVDPRHLSLKSLGLLALLGTTNAAGLGIEYVAFRRGKVGVITPIVSTEGAIAALIAVAAGVSIAAHTAVALLICTIGVVLAAAHPDPPDPTRTGPRSAVLAMASAILFGITLYTTGKVGDEVPIVWVLLPARLIGTAFLAAPLADHRATSKSQARPFL